MYYLVFGSLMVFEFFLLFSVFDFCLEYSTQLSISGEIEYNNNKKINYFLF